MSCCVSAIAQIATPPALAVLPAVPANTAALKLMPGLIGDDLEPDALAVTVNGGVRAAVYLQAPTSFNVAATLRSGIVDATVLAGNGGTRRAPIAILDAGGLRVYRAAAVAQEPTQIDMLATWAGAPAVWSGTNQAGQPIVFGANANGSAILRAVWNGTTLQELTPLYVPSTNTKMVAYNHDGLGEVELALLVGNLVIVVDWNTGAGLTWLPLQDTAAQLAVSRGSGTTAPTRDLLLVCEQPSLPSTASSRLLAWNSGNAAFLPMPSFPVSDIATYELNSPMIPSLGSLVLSSATDGVVQVMRRVPNASLFTAATAPVLVKRGPEYTGLQKVCGADFDGDGSGDLVAWQLPAGSGRPAMHVVPGAPLVDARVGIRLVGEGMTLGESLPVSSTFTAEVDWPAQPTSLLRAGETLEFEVLGWFLDADAVLMHLLTGAPLQYDPEGEVLLRLPLGPSVPDQVTLTRTRNTVLVPGHWSLDLRARFVCVGPGYRRPLPAAVDYVTAGDDYFDMNASIYFAMTGRMPGDGTSGDRNLTGGTGSAGTGVKRP